ncbi:MAG: pilin [Gammaproteobacteria bacterium]
MKTIQKGFTLIELMIVVAIIGILAAIAIPAYQDYTQRAQVGEAMTLVSAAKTAIAEYAQTNGSYPPTTGTALADLGLNAAVVGQYASFTVGAEGVITATMANNASLLTGQRPVGAAISNRAITFTPPVVADIAAGTVSVFKFECASDATTGIPTKFLPSSCKP